MAEPSMPTEPIHGRSADDGSDNDDSDDEGKGKGKTKVTLSKLEQLGLCPHKAFPSKVIDRSIFKTQKQYIEFLTQLKSTGQPWFVPPPAVVKQKKELKRKPLLKVNRVPIQVGNCKALGRLGDPGWRPPSTGGGGSVQEDMSRYIVMRQEAVKRKKKKKKKLFPSGVGYRVKVTKDLAFLFDVMADAKEVMVQKAIDNMRRQEEEERKAKETGNIHILKRIVDGMMFKMLRVEEERYAAHMVKERQSLRASVAGGSMDMKRSMAGRRKTAFEKRQTVQDLVMEFSDMRVPTSSRNEQLTKELVAFLKVMVEADRRQKALVTEDKAVSSSSLEMELAEMNMEEGSEEGEEEDVEEEEGDEDEEGDEGEDEDEGEAGEDEDEEGKVDMNEVKKRLESIATEEGEEDEEGEGEEGEEGEGGDVGSKEPSVVSEGFLDEPFVLTEDKSAQFDYFLERKLALQEKEPKNVTDDLACFLRTMMMEDETMREILREKELKDFYKRYQQFEARNAAVICTCKCKGRCKKCKMLKKKNKQQAPAKPKAKRCSSKKAGTTDDIIAGYEGYKLKPSEFMLMLQVVSKSLVMAEDLDEDRRRLEEEAEALRLAQERESTLSSATTEESAEEEEAEEEESDEEEEDEEEGEDGSESDSVP